MALSRHEPERSESRAKKSESRRISIVEPDREHFDAAVVGRDLSPGLRQFLKDLLRRKKWVRKINIPSGCEDAGAVLLFTTILKEGGLEISSELHVYCAGKMMVERWEVAGEREQIRSMSKESLQAIDIRKVRVDGNLVSVEFSAPSPSGPDKCFLTTFDFAGEGPNSRTVPHPLLRGGD